VNSSDLAAYVSRVHGRTREVAECLRRDLIGWRPRPGEFTAGELVLHIAGTRRMNLMRLAGERHIYLGHVVPPDATPAGLLSELDASAAEAAAALAGIDLARPLTIAPMGSGYGWQVVLGGLIEHEVHHRSQLCEYLSAAGIAPPALYGLHSEDLPRS
jgi:uncharacterized damage-inducible protein DinB